VAQKIGGWNWSASNKVAMSLLSRPVEVDEKEKEEFEGVAMLHVEFPSSPITARIDDLVGSHRSH
jgi:hypothetical protein